MTEEQLNEVFKLLGQALKEKLEESQAWDK
jgi:hypothetical protein